MSKHKIQIDSLPSSEMYAGRKCNMYTGERRVTIYMSNEDYLRLLNDGFFVRPVDKEDSAGIVNTTNVFKEQTFFDAVDDKLEELRTDQNK